MNLKLLIIIIGALIIGTTAYILIPEKSEEASGITVVTSFYPLYFFASEIGGDKASVLNITPAGTEPHEYEPTPQDMVRMQNSDVFVVNGAGFEAWADDVLENLNEQTVVIIAGEGLATLKGEAHEHEEEEDHEGHAHAEEHEEEDHEAVDPHVWLSPTLARTMVEKIAEGFAAADPLNEAYYRANANALIEELSSLDQEYQQGLSSCAKRDIITSHAAFGYIANAYDLNQVSISGLSTEEEPSPQALAEIADFAKERSVKYIFFETLVPANLSQTIANEIGAQTLVLNPLEGLTDSEITAGKNYLTEMRSNLTNLKTALECR